MTDEREMPADEVLTPTVVEKAEIDGADTIEVEWDGKSWEVPGSYMESPAVVIRGISRLTEVQEADGATVEDLAEVVDVLEAMLGRSQFRRWQRGKRSSFRDATELITAVMKAWGASLGE